MNVNQYIAAISFCGLAILGYLAFKGKDVSAATSGVVASTAISHAYTGGKKGDTTAP